MFLWFAEEGKLLTPRELFYICNRMIDLITDHHKEGLVCDVIDNGYIVLGLDEKVRRGLSFGFCIIR